MWKSLQEFWGGVTRPRRRHHYRAEKKMRDKLSEAQVDTMIDDSFPASDPPSTY